MRGMLLHLRRAAQLLQQQEEIRESIVLMENAQKAALLAAQDFRAVQAFIRDPQIKCERVPFSRLHDSRSWQENMDDIGQRTKALCSPELSNSELHKITLPLERIKWLALSTDDVEGRTALDTPNPTNKTIDDSQKDASGNDRKFEIIN